MKKLATLLPLLFLTTVIFAQTPLPTVKVKTMDGKKVNVPNMNYDYSAGDTINGQVETVKRLKYYMDNKNYDQAIELFSQKQQNRIDEIKKDPKNFEFWVKAWTMTDEGLEKYISGIKQHKGLFVFEDGIWKVDEN